MRQLMARADEPPAGRNLLPMVGQPPPERADAARNRRALLCAAQRILTESGVEGLSMASVCSSLGPSPTVVTPPMVGARDPQAPHQGA